MTTLEQDLALACRRLIKLIRNATKFETIEDMVGTINDVQSILDRRECRMQAIDVASFTEWTQTATDGRTRQFVSPCKRYRIELSPTGFATLFDYPNGMRIAQCGDVDDALEFAKKHARGEKWTA